MKVLRLRIMTEKQYQNSLSEAVKTMAEEMDRRSKFDARWIGRLLGHNIEACTELRRLRKL
jgi:hypothetical protein